MDYKIQILNKTRQGLDVFHHYIDFKFSPDKKFKNPLYHDTKASCSIHLSKKTGIYMMKDFGDLAHIAARFPSIVKHCFQISSF